MNFSRATISVIVFGLALWAGFKLGERIDLIESLVRISLEARADAEIPDSKHDQFNLLIIGLTDDHDPAAELESIWLAAFSKKTHNITFMPIFPSDSEPQRNQQLAESFYLDQGKPGQAFWQALESTHLWWQGYVLSDRETAIEIVDLMGGLYIDGQLHDGELTISSIPGWENNPQTAMIQQKFLLAGICEQLAQTNRLQSISIWETIFSHREKTKVQAILEVADWWVKLQEHDDFSCKFPTFEETQTSLFHP